MSPRRNGRRRRGIRKSTRGGVATTGFQSQVRMKARKHDSGSGTRVRTRALQSAAVRVVASQPRRAGSHQGCARRVLGIETEALVALRNRIDASFDRAVELLARCSGKVVVAGVGKSGIMCRKIAATLASTGSPALFLHAAESTHGDSGMLMKGDVVLVVSYSGESGEIVSLLPLVKRLRLPLIAMTGRVESTLARAADAVLDVSVAEEACSLGLAPTASTTATVALGDCLAIALLEHKGFCAEDFAVLHPSGVLGRRLLLRVADLMHTGAEVPLVHANTSLKDSLLEMTSKRLGVTGVVDDTRRLVGIITDGDLRRGLESVSEIHDLNARDLMTLGPKTIEAEALAAEAVATMEHHAITSLFILERRRPVGLIHLHDLLRAGVV